MNNVVAFILVFFHLFCMGISFSQSGWTADKQLDDFSFLNDCRAYYVGACYICPETEFKATLDTSSSKEGNACFRIEYIMSGSSDAGTTFEYGSVGIFSSKNNYTWDYFSDFSFYPYGLSLWIKGQEGNTDQLRFLLFEDTNANGDIYENEEVYQFIDGQTLGQNEWQRLEMPFSAFTKMKGKGDNLLTLNRVRAWRLDIVNREGTARKGTILIDDLRQLVTYRPVNSGQAVLNGTFVQLAVTLNGNTCSWSQHQWELEMQRMKDVFIQKMIVQYSQFDDLSWYWNTTADWVVTKYGSIDKIIAAAERKELKILLGLYYRTSLWERYADKADPTLYSILLNRHKKVIDELYDRFGSSPAFLGWYIPQEICEGEWDREPAKTLLANFLQNTAQYAKSKDASKLVAASSYFKLIMPADILQSWYEEMLSVARDIDILYVQDGVGTKLKDGVVDVPHYYRAIKNACLKHDVIFGSVVESFRLMGGFPVDCGSPFSCLPQNFNAFKHQLWEAGVFTPEIVNFSWLDMQSGYRSQSDSLYHAYNDYLNHILRPKRD